MEIANERLNKMIQNLMDECYDKMRSQNLIFGIQTKTDIAEILIVAAGSIIRDIKTVAPHIYISDLQGIILANKLNRIVITLYTIGRAIAEKKDIN